MTDPGSGVVYETRANHFKGSIAMGGKLTLELGAEPALVFRAHGVFQVKYELRLPMANLLGTRTESKSLVVVLADATRERFVVPANSEWQTLLTEAIKRPAGADKAGEDLVAKEHNRQVAIELARAGDGMLAILARQWVKAYEQDPSVPIFGVRPYWTPTGPGGTPQLFSTIGMRGLEDRLAHARALDDGDVFLDIMAADPHPMVRAAVRARLS